MVNTMATFDHNRTYGIEIEISWGRNGRKPSASALANALTRGGVPTMDAGYTHATMDTWKIVSDGSVTNGWELVSPILTGLNGKEQLRSAMRVVKSMGAVTHRSCGIHVHHGVRDFTAKQLANIANIYANNEGVIDQLVAPSRRGSANMYCKSMLLYSNHVNPAPLAEVPFYDWATQIPRTDLPMVPYQSCNRGDRCQCDDCGKKSRLVAKLAPGGRYYKVNFHSYRRQGTVEFRQHQSSLNAIKIWDWVVFTQMIVSIAKNKRGKAKTRIINDGNVATRPERALVRDLAMHKRIYQLDGSENYDDITMASMRRIIRRRDGIGFVHPFRFQNSVATDDPDDSDVSTIAVLDADQQHAATCNGTMVERMNRGTRERFMGCSNYRRGCRFTTQVVAEVPAPIPGDDIHHINLDFNSDELYDDNLDFDEDED